MGEVVFVRNHFSRGHGVTRSQGIKSGGISKAVGLEQNDQLIDRGGGGSAGERRARKEW
jgi:hypothetical protein